MSQQNLMSDDPTAAANAALAGPDDVPHNSVGLLTPDPDNQRLMNASPDTNQIKATPPRYADSPGQNPAMNPVQGTSDQIANAAGKSPSLWRSIVLGALAGVGKQIEGAGKGLLLGGIPGAVEGAVSPATADRAMAYKRQADQNALDLQTARARSAMQDVNFQKDNHEVQLAMAQAHLHQLDRLSNGLTQGDVDKLNQEGARFATQLREQGMQPIWSSDTSDTPENQRQDAVSRVQAEMQVDGDHPFSAIPLPNTDGGWSVFKIPDAQSSITHDMDIVIGHNADGSEIHKTFPAGSISKGQAINIASAAQVDWAKRQSAENLQRVKNEGSANVATIKANAPAKTASSDEWKPKVTADEKKKAELAENIASNANDVAEILQRRPDIVGAVAGRYTNAEQMAGNNDPDISALGTHIHNIAMANSGVHGFRSQEGVQSFEKQVLNNFHNGPRAVAGALLASVGSMQTFIDNARPDTYRTHSKNGGAIRAMRKQKGGNQ